jgi:hypothetical protein
MKTVTITIEIKVNDEGAFFRSAYNKARENGNPEALAYLRKEKTVNEAAVTIFDPVFSPLGSKILGFNVQEN